MNLKIRRAIRKAEENKIDFQVIKLDKRAISAKDVIENSKRDINLEEVCKTIVLKSPKGFLATFLPGDKRVNLEKIKELFGLSELRLAKAKELKKKLSFKPGEVCPLLLNFPLVMDNSVFKHDKVHFGSGDLNFGIEMNPRDILEMTDAKIEDITK